MRGFFPSGPYYNVKAARLAQAEEEIVVGEAVHEKRKGVGFTLAGDKRILQAQMRYRMDRAMSISASFDLANLICSGCKERGPHSVVGSLDGDPVVMVVTDQNIPAVMFSRDGNPCIAVVRVEDGTTKEIGFLIGDMLDGIEMPQGSFILLGSVSDIGRQGLVGYAEEMARTLRNVKARLGKNVQLAARRRTRDAVKRNIAVLGIGKVRRPEENVHTLPKGVEDYEKVRRIMVGWSGMPARATPLTEAGEGEIVETLVEELRTNFGVRVSENIDQDRSVTVVVQTTRYVMLGGSNCDRLGDVLKAMGKRVVKITAGGWRPTRQNVEAMVVAVREKVERDDVVVLMGLDNGTYYEEDEEGTRRLLRKDEENVYHVEGKLVVAAPTQVVVLMKNCREVLEEVPDNRKVLMGPGPRYLRCKCCDQQGHVTNFEDRGYRKDILCDLQEAKEALVDLCRECEMRNFKVTSPVDLMGLRSHMEEAEVEALLGTDPVHYSVTGFATMASNLIEMVEGPKSVFQAEKRGRVVKEGLPDGVDMGSWHRGNTEWLFNTVFGLGGWRGGRANRGR
jgi:hypothetical protein